MVAVYAIEEEVREALRANIPKNFQRKFRQCIDTFQRRIQEHRKRHDWMGVQEINNIFSEKET